MDIVERLRSGLADLSWQQDLSWAAQAADEIERLRAEVAELRPELNAWVKRAMKEADLLKKAEAERDRLRELLRSLRSVVMEDYRHLIDAALGGEGKDG